MKTAGLKTIDHLPGMVTPILWTLIDCAVADPGFPVGGGVDLVQGAVDPRGSYVSKILHVKTKESGPRRGGRTPGAPPLDLPMLCF